MWLTTPVDVDAALFYRDHSVEFWSETEVTAIAVPAAVASLNALAYGWFLSAVGLPSLVQSGLEKKLPEASNTATHARSTSLPRNETPRISVKFMAFHVGEEDDDEEHHEGAAVSNSDTEYDTEIDPEIYEAPSTPCGVPSVVSQRLHAAQKITWEESGSARTKKSIRNLGTRERHTPPRANPLSPSSLSEGRSSGTNASSSPGSTLLDLLLSECESVDEPDEEVEIVDDDDEDGGAGVLLEAVGDTRRKRGGEDEEEFVKVAVWAPFSVLTSDDFERGDGPSPPSPCSSSSSSGSSDITSSRSSSSSIGTDGGVRSPATRAAPPPTPRGGSGAAGAVGRAASLVRFKTTLSLRQLRRLLLARSASTSAPAQWYQTTLKHGGAALVALLPFLFRMTAALPGALAVAAALRRAGGGQQEEEDPTDCCRRPMSEACSYWTETSGGGESGAAGAAAAAGAGAAQGMESVGHWFLPHGGDAGAGTEACAGDVPAAFALTLAAAVAPGTLRAACASSLHATCGLSPMDARARARAASSSSSASLFACALSSLPLPPPPSPPPPLSPAPPSSSSSSPSSWHPGGLLGVLLFPSSLTSVLPSFFASLSTSSSSSSSSSSFLLCCACLLLEFLLVHVPPALAAFALARGVVLEALADAERTLHLRLAYAKAFAAVTSSTRAKRMNLPHFSLKKTLNIRTWLQLRNGRGFLKRFRRQRRCDCVVGLCFYAFIFVMLLVLAEFFTERPESAPSFPSTLLHWELLVWWGLGAAYLNRFMGLGLRVNAKFRNASVLLSEQMNIQLRILATAPHEKEKRERLGVSHKVLELAVKLLKEFDASGGGGNHKVSGMAMDPLLYNVTRVVMISAVSTVLSELMGFDVKMWKLKGL